jgi:hypothetical protein
LPARTPEERSLVAQIAAAERWGRTPDRVAATVPARAGLRAKFAREIDPDGTLDPAEVDRGVEQLLRAHMLRMSLKAKAVRREAREAAGTAEAGGANDAA